MSPLRGGPDLNRKNKTVKANLETGCVNNLFVYKFKIYINLLELTKITPTPTPYYQDIFYMHHL